MILTSNANLRNLHIVYHLIITLRHCDEYKPSGAEVVQFSCTINHNTCRKQDMAPLKKNSAKLCCKINMMFVLPSLFAIYSVAETATGVSDHCGCSHLFVSIPLGSPPTVDTIEPWRSCSLTRSLG